MDVMIAFGWASIMMAIGMFCRSKIGFLRNMLVPSCVIGGVLGFLLMNANIFSNMDVGIYNAFVSQLFLISFISVGLTGVVKDPTQQNTNIGKQILRGSIGMSFIFLIAYSIQPIIGMITILLSGNAVGMDAVYGLLVPFGFAQGPGQAAVFGATFESFGWADAAMIGVTFGSAGFLCCFLLGVPLAKYGIKKGLAHKSGAINLSIAKGYFQPEEQTQSMGKVTCYSGNVDTLAFHAVLIGIAYLLGYHITSFFAAIVPSSMTSTVWGLQFIICLVAGYMVKGALKVLKVDYLLDTETQKHITGWATDFLVISAFMAVQWNIVGKWIVPILLTCLICAVVTLALSIFLGQRMGDSNDFERTLGIFGILTGTVPSAMSLVRIVDPDLETTTAIEFGGLQLGALIGIFVINIPLYLSTAAGVISIGRSIGFLLLITVGYFVLMKICRVCGQKTYDLKKGIYK